MHQPLESTDLETACAQNRASWLSPADGRNSPRIVDSFLLRLSSPFSQSVNARRGSLDVGFFWGGRREGLPLFPFPLFSPSFFLGRGFPIYTPSRRAHFHVEPRNNQPRAPSSRLGTVRRVCVCVSQKVKLLSTRVPPDPAPHPGRGAVRGAPNGGHLPSSRAPAAPSSPPQQEGSPTAPHTAGIPSAPHGLPLSPLRGRSPPQPLTGSEPPGDPSGSTGGRVPLSPTRSQTPPYPPQPLMEPDPAQPLTEPGPPLIPLSPRTLTTCTAAAGRGPGTRPPPPPP